MSVLERDRIIDESARQRLRDVRKKGRRFLQNPLSAVGLLIVLTVILTAIFAPVIAPYPADTGDTLHFDQTNEAPSIEHPMGTDTVGRDVLTRVMYGARISLLMGLVVVSIAVAIGVPLGLVAGYLGGWVNTVIMRVTDIFLAIPPVLLALSITAVLTANLWNAMIAIAFGWWTWYARLVQGEVLSVKEEEFVEASESLGASWPRVAFKEILPNIVAPLTVKATLDMGAVILVGAALSFLGLGAQPPTPTWGRMISIGRDHVTSQWWLATFPGLAISFTVLGFNLLGDGLRDMFDVEVEE
ncbi:ABC transporter permease [Halorussus sp. AFM4]|uniref:ABC transporter permease n=1 Tax=Halorussus sp. AFM4 TaxID=3421651 RepID=UPI003EBC6824